MILPVMEFEPRSGSSIGVIAPHRSRMMHGLVHMCGLAPAVGAQRFDDVAGRHAPYGLIHVRDAAHIDTETDDVQRGTVVFQGAPHLQQ